ncbi:M14 family zinc carboxypeptidase [Promineifilum sp.]|uniref:M14 family zinc carboxypeptidase n=1 Tax=Promineifilum sp. TaxID=2664178 RepID=UPI0035B37298
MPSSPSSRPALLAGLLLALLLAIVLSARLDAQPASPAATGRGDRLVARVYYDNVRDIARLHAFDVWEYNNLTERYVLVAVDRAGYETLARQGWRLQVDEAATAQAARPMARRAGFLDGYRSLDDLYRDVAALAAAYPQLTELVDYGQSHCLSRGGCVTLGGQAQPGYPLQAIRVTNEAVAGSSTVNGSTVARGQKPILFLMAAVHAREITTPEIAMRFLEALVEGYGVDPDITWLVDWQEVWIVPVANPDGRWLVELGAQLGGSPFYQRKNANLDANDDGTVDCVIWPPPTGGGGQHYGVDLNRNHSFGWAGEGSSADPCDVVFHGPSPASEVETVALETLVRALFPDQRGPQLDDAAPDDTTGILVTLHSFSNLVLWPWGHLDETAPNHTDLKAIGDKLAGFNGYQSCQATACLYAAAGATDDWAYAELGIPAFTFEMGDSFMPPYEAIDAGQWPENRPALLYAARIARTPYQSVHGPDVLEVNVGGYEPFLRVTATVNDSDNGNRPIGAAAFSVDAPPWVAGVHLTSLVAADTSFDSPVEEVVGSIDTASLPPGRHLLFLRGQDSDGHWGPVSAAFFQVDEEPAAAAFLPAVVAGGQ